MITVTDLPGLAKHLEATDPHDLKKADVDLENVQNFPIASSAEAQAGGANNKYMTPLLTKLAIEALTSEEGLANHLKASNPHNVTKTTVGLSNVGDYGIASASEARDGKLSNKYMTPLRVHDAVKSIVDLTAMQTHLETNNPHNVTKTTVGLGNVGDFPVASTAEAKAGSKSDRYMTPLRVKEAIGELVDSNALPNHLKASNPHNITKTTVGLSKVSDYLVATSAEAKAGSRSDRYMTPLRVKEAISALVDSDGLSNHLKASNPHNITRTTVGLGNVQNYLIASTNEAKAGTRSDRYMTPIRVKEAISALVDNEPSEGPWKLARSGSEESYVISPVDLRGKEVCFVSTDTNNIDEIVVVKAYIPLTSGFSSDLQCYVANGYSDIEYKYSQRSVRTNGDYGNRQIWYRDVGTNKYPAIGTIKP